MSEFKWEPHELCEECGCSKQPKQFGNFLVFKTARKFPCDPPCKTCEERSRQCMHELGKSYAMELERRILEIVLECPT